MKKLLLITLALVSFSAFAGPKVGDKAAYTGTVTKDGAALPLTMTMEAVAFDSATDQFSVRSTYTINGQTVEAPMEHIKTEDMFNEEDMPQILMYCAQLGGALETVTVPAGSFQTCKLHDQNNAAHYVNFGAVPFGIVKANALMDGVVADLALASFVRGN